MGLGLKHMLLVSLAAGLIVQSCAGAGCPPYWTHYNGHCYRVTATQVIWSEANRRCREMASELVSVHSAGESFFVHQLWTSWTDTSCTHVGYWMGLNDIEEEGNFVWSDGSAVDFTSWSPGAPSNSNGNEDCVHMWVPAWNDLDCARTSAYVCKMNAY